MTGMDKATATRAAQRDDAVNGVRAIAVVAIMAHHHMPPDFFSFNVAKAFNALVIATGAYFFAGAVLGEGLALNDASMSVRARACARLIGRQIVRTWPLVAFTVALYVALGFVDGGALTRQVHRTWWLYLLEMGNVPKLLYGDQAFPGHLWVIAAQNQVAILIAMLMLATNLKTLERALPAIILAGFTLRLALTIAFMPGHPAWALEGAWSVVDVVGIGMLARFALQHENTRGGLRRTAWTSTVLAILLWVVLPNWNATYYALAPLIITMASVGAIMTVTDAARRARSSASLLCHPVPVFIGKMGLCLFLTHPFVNTVIVLAWPKLTGSIIPWWGLAALGPALSFPFAWLVHIHVERPTIALRASIGRPATPQKVASA